jgi:hypothetical protein
MSNRRKMPDWWITKDGDVTCLALYERHYSARRYKDGRKRKLFAGPGEKIVLRTAAGDALFVWRKFLDDCIDIRGGWRQQGINCAIFRSESPLRSSDLIRQACAIAAHCWPDRRYYTYVDSEAVGSELPGSCFIFAGWKYARWHGHRVRTVTGKFILEFKF